MLEVDVSRDGLTVPRRTNGFAQWIASKDYRRGLS
jgi:hypothetical protein